MPGFRIGDRTIGPEAPAYIIAELSANHRQDYALAERLVRAAAQAGADAVKLQTYTPDTITIDCAKEPFRIKGTLWEGRTLYDLYGEAYTPWEWHAPLKELAESLGMDLFSTPFDHTAVDFLEELGVEAYKVASFEVVDIPLLARIAATGRPVIMSTGMASLAEIEEAVEALRRGGCTELALLKCVSAYPAPPEEMNLRTIPELERRFGVVAGLSDHTLATAVAVASVALGGRIIEKHLTLAREDGGPDGAFSLEPGEFARMVADVRVAELALGRVSFEVTDKQMASRVFRRSLFVVADVKKGEEFTGANVRSIRPAHGMHTRYMDDVLGRRATGDIEAGTPLAPELITGWDRDGGGKS